MGFSKKQYQNFIRIVMVAAVAKEFRKAKIIEGVTNRAISDNKIATGRLINPESTGSIIPSRDDKWLIDRRSIVVSVGSIKYNLPSKIQVSLSVSYGVDDNYVFTRNDINAEYPEGTTPNINAIKNWIVSKSQTGLLRFTYKGKALDTSNDKQVSSVAYLIGRKISKEGISKKYRSDYFKPVDNKAKDVLQKGIFKASNRIMDLYENELYNSVLEAVDINIV